MSEFKFSCPNCQQNIQATSEYSGHQINCPSCQTLLVVPSAPDAPAPTGSKLSKAASTPHAQPSASATAAASFYANKPARKKKPKVGLIVGLSLGATAVVAAICFWPELMKKVSQGGKAAAAAEQAATNAPPPPPPELTTEEILQKVDETYKGLKDYAASAKTQGDVDMSAVAPALKVLHMTTTSSLQLGRTNHYRLEWEQNAAGKTVKGAAWNSGKGDYVGYGTVPPSKVKTRQLALLPAAYPFFLLSSAVVEGFFSDTNSPTLDAKDFTKTNNPNLNAQDNYVLAGVANHQSLLLWINKNTFLVTQIEVLFGGTISETELKKLPSTERAAMSVISKIKGSVTETYSNIQTNQDLLASAFESAYKPVANSAGAARPKRASSMAGELTQPGSGRRRQQ